MLRILLIGNQGQLGYELEPALAPLGEVQAVDYPAIDLTSPDATQALVENNPAQVIITLRRIRWSIGPKASPSWHSQ